MLGIVYALLASLCIGIHIFSIKYIQDVHNIRKLIYIIIGSFCLFIISRIFIYLSSMYLNISYVHVLLNLSILVSTALTIYIHKIKIDIMKFLCGFIILLFGIFIIYKSYL